MITTWDLLGNRRIALYVNISRLNTNFKDCATEIVFTPVISSLSKSIVYLQFVFPGSLTSASLMMIYYVFRSFSMEWVKLSCTSVFRL